jgi:hypothetical protein
MLPVFALAVQAHAFFHACRHSSVGGGRHVLAFLGTIFFLRTSFALFLFFFFIQLACLATRPLFFSFCSSLRGAMV